MSTHPAFQRTFWMNLYPDGGISGHIFDTKEKAQDRCTYTGDKPDAQQVEVRLVPVSKLSVKKPMKTPASTT